MRAAAAVGKAAAHTIERGASAEDKAVLVTIPNGDDNVWELVAHYKCSSIHEVQGRLVVRLDKAMSVAESGVRDAGMVMVMGTKGRKFPMLRDA